MPNDNQEVAWKAWRAALAAVPQQAAPAMPPGGGPCTVEFDGSDPEEVAYGPKVMMDRLAKRLGEHFERTIAEKAAPQQAASLMQREIALMEKAAKHAGITSLLNHGAASCVYSEGCAGVSQEHLLAYTREIALHCVLTLAAPQPEAAVDEIVKALSDAATSLETISRLAGRKVYGNPAIETCLGEFDEVRHYAASRAGVARAALAAQGVKP